MKQAAYKRLCLAQCASIHCTCGTDADKWAIHGICGVIVPVQVVLPVYTKTLLFFLHPMLAGST